MKLKLIDNIKKYLDKVKPENNTKMQIVYIEGYDFIFILSDIKLTRKIEKHIKEIIEQDATFKRLDMIWRVWWV